MHTAIKTLEDTLFIRRLQERQLCHEKESAERIAAVQEDIASLERGLRLLEAARDQRSEVSDQKSGPSSGVCRPASAPKCPTIGDPAQNPPEAV